MAVGEKHRHLNHMCFGIYATTSLLLRVSLPVGLQCLCGTKRDSSDNPKQPHNNSPLHSFSSPSSQRATGSPLSSPEPRILDRQSSRVRQTLYVTVGFTGRKFHLFRRCHRLAVHQRGLQPAGKERQREARHLLQAPCSQSRSLFLAALTQSPLSLTASSL